MKNKCYREKNCVGYMLYLETVLTFQTRLVLFKVSFLENADGSITNCGKIRLAYLWENRPPVLLEAH